MNNALALDLDPSPSPSPCPTPSPLKSMLARRASGRARAGSNDDDTLAVDVPMRSFQGGYYPLLIALYRHLGIPLQPANFTFSFSSLPPQPDRALVRARATRPIADDTYFIHSGASGASVPSIPSVAWRSPFTFVQAITSLLSVAVCYAILVLLSLVTWHGLIPSSTTFRTLVDTVAARLEQPHHRLPRTPLGRAFRSFATDIVLPLFSAVGTMTAEDVWDTRASVLLDYIHAGMGTSHYVLGNGHSARDVARLLADPVRAQGRDRVRLGTAIRTMKYRPAEESKAGEIVLSLEGGEELAVDRVVVATQASTARALLATIEPSLLMHGAKAEARRVSRMHTALADVQYRDTIAVTHRDASVLPAGADVRDINLVQPAGADAGAAQVKEAKVAAARRSSESEPESELVVPPLTPAASDSSAQTSPCPTPRTLPPSLGVTPYFPPSGPVYTMATHVIAPGPGVAPVLQTTNPVVPVDADSVLGIARLERALPLRDDRTLAGLRPTPEGDKEKEKETPLIYLAGSYAYPGIPLLEGCVGSARRAVEDMFGTGVRPETGGVDWSAGQGGLVGRMWRWRWRGRGGY